MTDKTQELLALLERRGEDLQRRIEKLIAKREELKKKYVRLGNEIYTDGLQKEEAK